MACGGGHKWSSTYHDHQEEDVKEIIKSLDDIQRRIYELKFLAYDVHELDALHLKDVITTKHALKYQYDEPVKLRIASWNLKHATMKGKHVEKIEMIVCTIAHINPDIIALQEISSSPRDLLKTICYILSEPWGYEIALVGKNEYSAFLWKNCGELQIKKTSAVNLGFSRKVQAMDIQIGPFEFTLLNFHFAPRYNSVGRRRNDCEVQHLKRVSSRLVQENFPPKNLILIGDFNTYPIGDDLNKQRRFENILKPQQYTNAGKNQCYDNIIVHQKLKLCCTSSSVQNIEEDLVTRTTELRHILDHYPICAEFEIPRKLNIMPHYGYCF